MARNARPRIQGLSRTQYVNPLLSQVYGRSRAPPQGFKQQQQQQQQQEDRPKTPEDIEAPPVGSDSELSDEESVTQDEARTEGTSRAPQAGSASSSGAEAESSSTRGGITRTQFGSGASRESSTLRSRTQGRDPLTKQSGNAASSRQARGTKRGSSDLEGPTPRAPGVSENGRASRGSMTPVASEDVQDPFEDAWGFSREKKTSKTYGGSNATKAKDPAQRPGNTQAKRHEHRLRMPGSLPSSPEFKTGQVSYSKTKPRSPPQLRLPAELPSSPGRKAKRPRLRQPEPLPDSPGREPADEDGFKLPESLPNSPTEPPRRLRTRKGAAASKEQRANAKKVDEIAQATFKLPAGLPGMIFDDDLAKEKPRPTRKRDFTTRSNMRDDEKQKSEHDDNNEKDDEPELEPLVRASKEVCPMCGQRVDKELLRRFNPSGKKLRMDQQMKFCHHHKVSAARSAWARKGYPDIDWARLDARCGEHHGLLERLIAGRGESRYRTALEDNIAAGKERTLKKTDRSLAPGYYGNKGLRIMSEHVVRHLGPMLQERAIDDKVVSARGPSVFVSTVLVPELAARLIMEDMGVDLEEARGILEESVSMGDLLHEDQDDVVEDVEEEEEGKLERECERERKWAYET